MSGSLETSDLLLRIFNLDVFNDFNRMNRHGWYISTIIGMYIIFAIIYFLCSKLKNKHKFIIAAIIISLIVIAFRATSLFIGNGSMYTRELPTFAIGIIYATFYKQFNSFFSKYFWPSFIICFIGFWVGFFTMEISATYSAALIIIILSQKITYYSNITYFLGKICLGVYLFLYFSTLALQPFVNNPYWWVLLNAGFILELSTVLYGVQIFIQNSFKKIKIKIKNKQIELIKN